MWLVIKDNTYKIIKLKSSENVPKKGGGSDNYVSKDLFSPLSLNEMTMKVMDILL